MGFKAISTSRSAATTAVSKQATIINTGTNFAVTGATITANTSVSINVNTPGQAPNTAVAGLSISSINYLNADGTISTANAVSTSGGNIKINGAGFTSPMTVVVGGTTVSNANVNVANTTAIIANLGSASPGNVSVYAFNAAGTGAQLANAVNYSGVPAWTTSSISLVNGTESNVALVASSDSTLTYTLQAGSSLPTGMSLISTGYISGTPTGYSNTTVLTPVIVATDVEGQATQQTITITVAVSEPYFPYVTLLLNGDTGTNAVNNATNNVFVDSSTNNFTVTRTGTTTQGSFTPFSQTGWSNYLDGNGDYLSYPVNAATQFGASNWTIEFWMNVPTLPSTRTEIFYLNANTSGYAAASLHICANNKLGLSFSESGGSWRADDATGVGNAITAGAWQHVALVRSGQNIQIYLDGAPQGAAYTTTASNTSLMTTYTLNQIGVYNSGFYFLTAYMSNFRVVIGTALYTTSFTPPTSPLTAISGTGLLTCQSNRFIDNSSNAFTITINGNPYVQALSPFSPSSAYSAASNGGAAYLDGSGNYLSVATNAALNITSGSTDSFICEGWFYWTAVSASTSLVDNGGVTGVSFPNWAIYLDGTSQIALNWGNSGAPGSSIGTITTSVVPKVGQWYHIALVKTNADWSLFVNGVRGATYPGLNTAAKSSASALFIGYGITTQNSGSAFKGYISNLRIYKGATASAPYSATSSTITIPSSPVTAITNTQLLTNFTNGGIVDAHSTTALQTAGDAKASTVVTKFGTTSIYFDGTGDYLTTQQLASPNYDLVACNFTIEGWFYNSGAGAERYIFSQRGSGTGWEFRINSTNAVQFFYTSGSTLTSIGTVSANTWTHLAVSRSGTTVRIFINGNLDNSTTFSNGTSAASSYPLYIGNSTSAGGGLFLGYMEDIRITKGFARYTANFPVPTTGFLGQ